MAGQVEMGCGCGKGSGEKMIKEAWSDSTGSYIRITGDEQERMADRVLAAHPVNGVLPLDIELVNGHREYVFETSGYRLMSDRLEDQPLSKIQWLHLLDGLIKIGDELESYLLDSEHLVLDADSLYVRESDGEVGCLYIAEHRRGFAEGLNHLVEQVLKFPEYDREQAEFIYRLHAATTGSGVTRTTVRDFLREEGGFLKERSVGDGVDRERKDGEKTREASLPGKANNGKAMSVGRLEKKSFLLPLCLLAAGILIPTICLRLGIFQSAVSGETDLSTAIPAYLFFVLVAGYGAYRVWPPKTPSVVWDEEDELSVCLLPETAGYAGKEGLSVIPVGFFPWKLGSDERQVDSVIDREGVAPEHARIEKESHAILLIDEESPTGTLLNEKRLVPWEKHRLRDGDRVSFGSAGYVVEITD